MSETELTVLTNSTTDPDFAIVAQNILEAAGLFKATAVMLGIPDKKRWWEFWK